MLTLSSLALAAMAVTTAAPTPPAHLVPPRPHTIAIAPVPLTSAERAEVLAGLQTSRTRLLVAIDGLSEAQWRFKPGSTRWSIAEVAEHIALVDRGISDLVYNQIDKAADSAPDAAADALTARIKGFMSDRTQKASAPEGFVPSGTWPDRLALTSAFSTIRNNLEVFASTTDKPLRYHRIPHPAFGPMDGYQWLVMLAAHADRHVQQIEEVKRAPGYPSGK